MAEDTQDRTEAVESESKGGFRVPLSESPNAAVVPEFQTLDDDTGAEDEPTEKQDASAQDAEEGGDKPELPSAEELGVDPNSPVYKELHKKFTAAYSRWLNKKQKSMQPTEAKPSETPKEPEQKQAAPAQTDDNDPYAEVYKVPFDAFKPEVRFREGSDLAAYKDELSDLITQVASQAIQHTLSTVQSNDRGLRQKLTEQQQVNQARIVIEKYAQAIADHPDYESKAKELADLAESTQALAKRDPEKWVRMAAQMTGLDPNWRDDAETEQAQRGRESVKLATKLRSVTPRGNTPTKLNGAPSGNLGFDSAFENAWRSSRGNA